MNNNHVINLPRIIIIMFFIIESCILIPTNPAPAEIQADSNVIEQTSIFELPPEWTKTFTQEPTSTNTQLPTSSKTNTQTPTSSKTKSCDANDVIVEIKSQITF